jgi:diguanylate cyclase (GGDEF)-like protein
LTHLGNRRHFEARLKEEAAYATRRKQPFSLVLLDLDHFKAINDTFGHEEGDRVLAHFAETLRSILRQEDAAFRYGGEEFVVLLRATGSAAALTAAERLRAALKGLPVELGDPSVEQVITFSAGVAAADDDNAFETATLVTRADAALYRAKRSGRDRVELAALREEPVGTGKHRVL